MHAWEQIQLTLDFIEEHLNEDISTEYLAGLAALSPFYYQRLFRRLVKKPVGEYIKLRRMAKATELLLNKDQRILDTALDLAFLPMNILPAVLKKPSESHRRNTAAVPGQ